MSFYVPLLIIGGLTGLLLMGILKSIRKSSWYHAARLTLLVSALSVVASYFVYSGEEGVIYMFLSIGLGIGPLLTFIVKSLKTN
ncbi:hypothetical protein [Pontibacillus halophilus]|nr:hypothetical protein [Pontibacillus halophilus]